MEEINKNCHFIQTVYCSVVPGDVLKFSCLSNSLQVKMKSDKTYFFKISIYSPNEEKSE